MEKPLYKKIISIILLFSISIAEIYFLVTIAIAVFMIVVCTAGIGLIAVIPLGTAFFAGAIAVDRWLLRYGGYMKPKSIEEKGSALSNEEQTLVDYFVKARKEGFAFEVLTPALKQNGWTDADIQTAQKIVKAAEQLSAPKVEETPNVA